MAGTYEIYVTNHFSAAHALKGYPGDCARMHGHNWMTEVYVQCTKLDSIGIGLDFRDIKKAVSEVVESLDHCTLNDLPAFQTDNPTSEHIARYLYQAVGKKLNNTHVRVSKVKVCETPEAGAFYWED